MLGKSKMDGIVFENLIKSLFYSERVNLSEIDELIEEPEETGMI